ncbi:MAG TPA: FAD-binding protein, partial [Devosia sp.]|nr:FAD-binding protein [Devosia sp.]
MDDVIIVGGSFAGLAAALQLGRARRQVTVF